MSVKIYDNNMITPSRRSLFMLDMIGGITVGIK